MFVMVLPRLLAMSFILLAAQVLANEWTLVDLNSGSLDSNGYQSDKSPLSYRVDRLSAGFQTSIRMFCGEDCLSYLSPNMYTSMSPRITGTTDISRKRSLNYYVIVQFQLADGTYLGAQRLITQGDNTLGSGSYGIYQDFYLDVPGCGKQRFNRRMSEEPTGYSLLVTGSETLLYLEATWTFTSYAPSYCPPVFAGIFFITDQEDLSPYFTTTYLVKNAEMYNNGRRRRAADMMMAKMADPPIEQCLKPQQDTSIGLFRFF